MSQPYDVEAQRLRAEGLTYREIGQRMGITTKCAWRACNREHVRDVELNRNDYKREHERNHRALCPRCGEPMRVGSGCEAKRPSRCAGCRNTEAWERTAQWLELRRQGLANYEIAGEAGVPTHVVATALQRSRVARFPDLTWLPAPYAAARGVA